MTPVPYFERDGVFIYCGDNADWIANGDPSADLLLTDPPYGVAEKTDRFSRGRSSLARANDFPPVHNDDRPFDPSPLLRYERIVLFGANYFAQALPPSPS
jgi:site-specific DNA-methyltransferase (adenine-specific)